MDKDKLAIRKALRARCRRVEGHGQETPFEVMRRIADWCEQHAPEFDAYGSGSVLQDFETKIAALLGFPAARFMPTGKVAQNSALRVWSERSSNRHVGMHPTSHLELHEERAYSHLFQLRATLVGPVNSPLLAEHLAQVAEPLAALLVELPIREAGGQLPTWEELEALKQAARERGTKLHLDGARLWETAAYYGRGYDEICSGFDSVYVSFYKGIGALSGAMLLGPEDFILEATVWQQRCGGVVYSLLPYAASAAMQFDARLARMPAHFEHALALAEAINAVPGVHTLPRRPHVNMLHIFLPMSADAAYEARDELAETRGVWLFTRVRECDVPGYSRFELYVGEATANVAADEFAELYTELVAIHAARTATNP